MTDAHTQGELIIGSGRREEIIPLALRTCEGAGRIGLVIDTYVAECWPAVEAEGARLAAEAGAELVAVRLPQGEAAKTRAVLEVTQDALVELRRDEPVLAVGGGATTDLAGFAAATLRRGLPWIAVPTTLLAMVDAAHGGKTGINHPRGKNLLGAFHAPACVVIDVDFLRTLDPRELRSGAAELYKTARVGDAELCARLAAGLPPADDASAFEELIRMASVVKRRLVSEDPLDRGVRRLLNYGHTVGHALETLLGNETVRHGEAVAIGMQVAMHVSAARGWVKSGALDTQARVLTALGLPTDMPGGIETDAVLTCVGLDKKRGVGADFVMVLPTDEQGATVAQDVSVSALRAAIDAARSR